MTSTPPNAGTAPTPSPSKVTTKTFVLDTSVLLFDHSALSRFEENQVAIPITVLEELDQFKVGNETKNFEARECIRIIDRLSKAQTLQDWIDIDNGEGGKLKIVLHKESEHSEANQVFGSKSNDHRILDAALKLQKEDPTTVVTLVTKDINLRLKAKALELPAEDYKNGQVRDVKLRFTGKTLIEGVDADDIRKLYVQGSTRKITMLDPYRQNNHYYVLRNGSSSALGYFSEATRSIERIDKDYAYGIKPRNAEQAFALHAIMNPDGSLVTICGVAGTGKTLLALAGALEQRNRFDQIILARPIVALSNRDIGFLPGDAEEKINPYMQPLWDNLNFIKSQFGENERKSRVIEELKAQKKITICPLAYIRGWCPCANCQGHFTSELHFQEGANLTLEDVTPVGNYEMTHAVRTRLQSLDEAFNLITVQTQTSFGVIQTAQLHIDCTSRNIPSVKTEQAAQTITIVSNHKIAYET